VAVANAGAPEASGPLSCAPGHSVDSRLPRIHRHAGQPDSSFRREGRSGLSRRKGVDCAPGLSVTLLEVSSHQTFATTSTQLGGVSSCLRRPDGTISAFRTGGRLSKVTVAPGRFTRVTVVVPVK
jgi:hypothetical protein